MRPRHLLPLAIPALLWIRQIRFERRIAHRQGYWEREASRGIERYGEEVNRELVAFANQVGKRLARDGKQINENFEELARRVDRR